MPGRLAERLAVSLRLTWRFFPLGAGAGFALQAFLPMEDAWLAAAAGGACATLGLALMPIGREPTLADVPPRIALERWSAWAQFGHAFVASALALGGLAAGAGLASLLGL